MNRSDYTLKQISQAGTGFMLDMVAAIHALEQQGYDENLSPRFDHLSCQVDAIELYPKDFEIDDVIRFENTSDPDDQAILYAISSPSKHVKGLYIESYGLYHEALSEGMLKALSDGCRKHAQIN